jgi:predicted GNAT superfamily acetyltransferase
MQYNRRMNQADDALELRRATTADIDDIVTLLQDNETTRGGMFTGHFDRPKIAATLDDMPVIVARRREFLAGVLISASIRAGGHSPAATRMLETYRGGTDAYVYGPICIDARERGQGLAGRLFARLKTELPGREGILYIRQDNAASIRAHRDKLGMAPRGTFAIDGIDHVVLSYRG